MTQIFQTQMTQMTQILYWVDTEKNKICVICVIRV